MFFKNIPDSPEPFWRAGQELLPQKRLDDLVLTWYGTAYRCHIVAERHTDFHRSDTGGPVVCLKHRLAVSLVSSLGKHIHKDILVEHHRQTVIQKSLPGLLYIDYRKSELRFRHFAARHAARHYQHEPVSDSLVSHNACKLSHRIGILRNGPESKTVTLPFDERTFAFFNTAEADWHRSDGEYEILIGASSRDIRLSAKRKFAFGESSPVNARRAECPVYYDIAAAAEIPADQFRALYDKPIPPNVPSKRGEFDDNTTLGEFGCCLLGKLILKAAPALIKSQVPNADMTTMLILTQGMHGMPLRALVGISSGIIDSRLVDGLLLWGNKHRLRGFFKMIAGLFGSLSNIEKKNRANMQRKLKKRAEQKAKAKEQND